MRRPIERLLRRTAALVLAVLVASPEIALAAESSAPAKTKSLDSMSQAELDALVADINHEANWRKYRRPGDPPDFEPGKPVRVMHGAGAMLGRGGHGGRSFRQAGLAGRRGGAIGGNRRGSDRSQQSAMERGRGSSRSSGSSFGSSSSRSSFGSGSSSSRSSFGSGSSFGNGSSFGSGSNFGNGMN